MSSEIVPISEIKKRKSASEAYRDAYETPNPHENTGFSRRSRKIQRSTAQMEITPEFAVIDFRDEQPTTAIAKIPSIKALATIPSRSMSATAQALPSKQKQGYVSKVSPQEISVSKPRSAKSRRNYKKIFNDVVNIQDATFTDEFGETPAMSAISAQKIKSLAAGKKQEPESMRAISAQKAKTKSQLTKVEPTEKIPTFVSDGFRVEPASTVKSAKKAQTINDRWLIDKAADELYGAVRVAGKVGKTALKEGFKGAKTGIKAVNELSELAIQNPVLIQIGKVHTENMNGMAAGARRARGSILATGNNVNKRYMSAGSLVTQHGFVNRTNTGAGSTGATQRVFPKIVHRKGGDIVKYFSAAGIEISAAQARRILGNAPLPTAPTVTTVPTVNQAVATTATYPRPLDTGIHGVVNPLGTQRRQGNPIGEITRATTASGLVRRAKTTVGVVPRAVQIAYTPTGAVNTATTATNVMKNPTGFVKRNHSPVVDITRIVTPSRLLYRHVEA